MKNTNTTIIQTASAQLPTKFGLFRINVYQTEDGTEHITLIKGNINNPMLVRLHSSCATGDIFGSLKCDCGEQLEKSLKKIEENGNGVLLYLNQEGRGIGLTNKIKAYALQEKGYDTVEANEALGLPADARDYKIAADMLLDLGIDTIYLLTNNPDKEEQLHEYGITIAKRIRLETMPNKNNKEYLKTKKQKMAHQLLYV